MEKLTEKQYKSLVEAYSAVYNEDHQSELNEEQQINEFLEIVNSLVEEGYDLSEYSYDELYELHLNEGLGRLLGRAGQEIFKGAKVPTIKLLQGIGKAAIPLGVAAGLDQFFTGGKGREYTGAAIGGARQLGHSIPGTNQVNVPQMPSIPTVKPTPTKPAGQNPIQLPPGYKVIDGKVVREETIIKNHLLDNGYASTERQAITIMANMSENWQQNILGNVK